MCTFGLGAVGLRPDRAAEPRLGIAPASGSRGIGGLALFVAFLLRQRTVAHRRSCRSACSGSATSGPATSRPLFIYGALSLNGFVVAVYLQQGAGLPATLAGLASLPTTSCMILLSSRVGALSGRFGPRLFMTVGPLVMAAGALLLLTVRDDFNYWTQVLPGMIVFGLGISTHGRRR